MARHLAQRLGYTYIDTGAMYRAITLNALNTGLITSELKEKALVRSLNEVEVDFTQINNENTVRLNGEIVEDEIRSLRVSNWVSEVSKIPAVRLKLRHLQQKMSEKKGVVMDGRDIGSAVLPDAELKIFMTADPKIRAQRRYQEMLDKGVNVEPKEVIQNISHRDYVDTTRKENPLVQVEDAKVLDNSNLSRDEQLQIAENWVKEIIQNLE